MKSLPDYLDVSITLTPCHAERSLTKSEANRQTETKDPCQIRTPGGNAVNFRIVIRFHDEQGIEFFPDGSHEAAPWESPLRKCRVSRVDETSPVKTARTLPAQSNTK